MPIAKSMRMMKMESSQCLDLGVGEDNNEIMRKIHKRGLGLRKGAIIISYIFRFTLRSVNGSLYFISM